MLGRITLFTVLVSALGCGGNVFRGDGSGNASGSGNTSGGVAGSGNASGAGGATSAGGAAGTGGNPCEHELCAEVDCQSGWHSELVPGDCCPICVPDHAPPDPSCVNVVCQPVPECRPGYQLGRAPGACCDGCVPISEPAPPPDCSLIDCAPPPLCPEGYVSADPSVDCCGRCVPDPNYCREDADCMIADRPRSCCGCPEAISLRHYYDDPCWSALEPRRPIPPECYPEAICDRVCGACSLPLAAICSWGTCAAKY